MFRFVCRRAEKRKAIHRCRGTALCGKIFVGKRRSQMTPVLFWKHREKLKLGVFFIYNTRQPGVGNDDEHAGTPYNKLYNGIKHDAQYSLITGLA